MDVGCTIYDVRLLGMTQDWRTQDSGFFHQISFINLPESTHFKLTQDLWTQDAGLYYLASYVNLPESNHLTLNI